MLITRQRLMSIICIKECAKAIEKLLVNLNSNKASGPDKIKSVILETVAHELPPILEILFQKSIEEGDIAIINGNLKM